MDKLTITRPDDWHLHLRDGDALKAVLPDTAKRFGRAIIMPNLRPPVTTTELASAYRQRILDAAVPAENSGTCRALTGGSHSENADVALRLTLSC